MELTDRLKLGLVDFRCWFEQGSWRLVAPGLGVDVHGVAVLGEAVDKGRKASGVVEQLE